MNFSDGREQVVEDTVNVVSLFGNIPQTSELIFDDPLENLIQEAMIEDEVLTPKEVRVRKVVSENQFPDQSMYTLEEQLANLRSSLNRIKFYLGDIDDLLPR
jgi:hypothetical protein